VRLLEIMARNEFLPPPVTEKQMEALEHPKMVVKAA